MPIWDGTGPEALADRVFEREVTEEGRRVSAIDAVGSDLASGMVSPKASVAVEQISAEAGSRVGKKRAPPLSPGKRRGAGGGGGGGGERLGSLSSPLARIFGTSILGGQQGQTQPPPPSVEEVKNATSAAMQEEQQSVKERLERIEEALQLLLGEVVRNGGTGGEGGQGTGSQVPLTSLTGEVEPSYTD